MTVPDEEGVCPLSECHLGLLQAMWSLETEDTDRLAAALFLTPNTVRTYCQRILALLGVHTRGEAMMHAVKAGWIEIASDPSVPPPP